MIHQIKAKPQTQAIARLKEVAEIHNFEVEYSFKDLKGHGVKTGKQTVPAASKDGARKAFLSRWKREKGHEGGPVSVKKITDRGVK